MYCLACLILAHELMGVWDTEVFSTSLQYFTLIFKNAFNHASIYWNKHCITFKVSLHFTRYIILHCIGQGFMGYIGLCNKFFLNDHTCIWKPGIVLTPSSAYLMCSNGWNRTSSLMSVIIQWATTCRGSRSYIVWPCVLMSALCLDLRSQSVANHGSRNNLWKYIYKLPLGFCASGRNFTFVANSAKSSIKILAKY